MPAPDSIRQLVEHFKQNQPSYRSGKFNEAQLRLEFLNPLFEALGWDVSNRSGYAEAYKDVVVEPSLEVEGELKAPDYAFRIGGTRKFFVEAKKPAVNIQYEIYPAFQLRRYAWSAKLPLGILTDFEEFAVYDCRSKPNPSDKAATGRVMFLRYTDYIEQWDEIAGIFSKDAVMKGSFDQYAQGATGKHGTQEVDDAFLKEIEGWRDLLARNLAIRNSTLSVPELNYAVQMTIDRIVFLRICEDRGIEPQEQLKNLQAQEDIYGGLCALFRQADRRYNSGLFHFENEKGQSSSADGLSLGLKIDDKALKEIIKSLYFPCPYVFSVIPADILGQVYERFLGKVIRLTEGHQAKVEEKPEVRKAGGVYYTPTYIVEYIVKNTVGKLLEGKTPKEAAELKIVDPACGSGSFLLGAYQYLLDWHVKWYSDNDPQGWARAANPRVYQAQGGEWKLTTAEKKRILLDNMHGVDIDPQAVEVTKLSLSLKVLEGESQESIGTQLGLFKERALPDLGRNIQCGNSLIGPDYYADRQLDLGMEGAEERSRVNAFDWQSAFPHAFARGGFDAVIGNPPYIDSEWLTKTNPELRTYCNSHYQSARGNWDIFCIFIEKGIKLCRDYGLSSMIVPNKLISSDYASSLRNYISQNNTLIFIRDYSSVPVFPVSVYPYIYVIESTKPIIHNELLFEKMELNLNGNLTVAFIQKINLGEIINIGKGNWSSLFGNNNLKIINKILNGSTLLKDCAEISGSSTVSEAYKFIEFISEEDGQDKNYFKFVNTGTIDRYSILWGKKPTTYIKNKYKKPIFSKSLINKITIHRQNQARSEKIIIGGMNKYLECTYDDGKIMTGKSTSIVMSKFLNLQFLLGLLNSKLITFYYKTVFSGLSLQGGFLRIGPPQLKELPIRIPDFESMIYKKIVRLVGQMLIINGREMQTPQEKEALQREIEATDKQIDALVYELYGLTEEEIKIVEESK